MEKLDKPEAFIAVWTLQNGRQNGCVLVEVAGS